MERSSQPREIFLLEKCHAEPAAAAKHLGLGVNPSPLQTLHFVQGDNRKTLSVRPTSMDNYGTEQLGYDILAIELAN